VNPVVETLKHEEKKAPYGKLQKYAFSPENMVIYDLGRGRTCNLLIRSQTLCH
jgi:hypothetical protein